MLAFYSKKRSSFQILDIQRRSRWWTQSVTRKTTRTHPYWRETTCLLLCNLKKYLWSCTRLKSRLEYHNWWLEKLETMLLGNVHLLLGGFSNIPSWAISLSMDYSKDGITCSFFSLSFIQTHIYYLVLNLNLFWINRFLTKLSIFTVSSSSFLFRTKNPTAQLGSISEKGIFDNFLQWNDDKGCFVPVCSSETSFGRGMYWWATWGSKYTISCEAKCVVN